MEPNETTTGEGASVRAGDNPNQSTLPNIGELVDKAKQQTAAEGPKKRGRPPGRKNSVPAANSPVLSGDRTPVYEVDIKLVEKVFRSGLITLDGMGNRKIAAQCKMIGLNPTDTAEILESQKATPEEIQTLSELGGVLAQKYGFLGQYAPEFMFAVVGGGLVVRKVATWYQMSSLIKQAAQRQAAKKYNAPVVHETGG